MNFKKRLLYYLLGFGLGCVMVWAMFYRNNDRPSWLPQGRVLEFLAKVEVQISDELTCKLACDSIPLDFMNKDFFKAAKIDFKQSATERTPCPEYKIISTLSNNKSITIYIETCELTGSDRKNSTATLRNFEIETLNTNCDCP